jgi:hypothetical protein
VSPGAIAVMAVAKPPEAPVAVWVNLRVPVVTDVVAVATAVNDAKTEELTKADPPSAAEITTTIFTDSRPADRSAIRDFRFIYFSSFACSLFWDSAYSSLNICVFLMTADFSELASAKRSL